ncbi:DUF2264 domain-containing protein [Pelagicoccus sp. SDUM812003]|uniref:DUF2264 domain-containing protein n=1 Tax=Pelagicoccus sp. SDUM812003 TaxID=3041267 RepID=UPI00280E72DE|nr:DUF2264 domain-containing protein [Pelagicoccus sp. SDUM812003]MDQ8201794.1 DUF2264 domain-containing protein [Pelagicoccus sp. SDUM812003]
MKRRDFLAAATASGALTALGKTALAQQKPPASQTQDDYAYFSSLLQKISGPVLELFASERFHSDFPIEVNTNTDGRDNRIVHLECFGRTIAGAAPWLANTAPGPDLAARDALREMALLAYEHSVDPQSSDYFNWELDHGQLLVDSAYYTQAMLRAPFLWEQQSRKTQQRIVAAIKSLRRVSPPYTNWLLFAAMNEAFLMQVGEQYDPIRLELTLRKFQEWYVGDGWFADGQHFAFDYYNSYVIHPMLLDILEVMTAHDTYYWHGDIQDVYDLQLKRSQRFAEHLERLISPSGTYPPIGRSLTYRTTAFQLLAQLALKKQLPETLPSGRVRSALRAVHEAIFSHPSNFTEDGYLRIGFAGGDLALGDWYSNSGSMYITTASFLPLGLPADDAYWTEPSQDWTQKLAFSGRPFRKDYSVEY